MGLNYNPTIVPDGLILYLDPANSRSYSGSGNTWYDLSGNSLNATLVNSPSYTVSNRGTFVLDGSSNYFTLPNNSILSLSEFTISIWVKALQLNADQFLIDTSSSASYGYGYSFRIRSNNTIRFWAYDANTLVDTTETITSNVWYHITVSYSNFTKTQRIYINGSLSASAQHTNAFALADPQYLRIGHSQILGGYSKAVIGQSMFYNRELSASEIKQNYDATKGRFLTPENIVTNGLVLYVDSSKSNSYAGFGNTIYDLSSSGNTGILTNGPAFSGLNDGSIVFDGVDDYINFGNNSTLQQNSGTLSAWVKASSPGSVYRGIIAKRLAYGLFYLNSVLIAYDWVANTARSTGINIADNTWKNVVLTYQSGVSNGTSIYINGVSVLTTTITIYDQTANLYGGAEANATQFASCQASSFSMYNRALTQQEILQNYNATKSRFGL